MSFDCQECNGFFLRLLLVFLNFEYEVLSELPEYHPWYYLPPRINWCTSKYGPLFWFKKRSTEKNTVPTILLTSVFYSYRQWGPKFYEILRSIAPPNYLTLIITSRHVNSVCT